MAIQDEDQIFTALAIRDQNDHDSTVVDTAEFRAETIVIENGLNQDVTFQLQGSRDKSTWLDIDDTFNVAASTNAYRTVTDYFPYYRVVASCGTSPTSGVLDVWILKALGGA